MTQQSWLEWLKPSFEQRFNELSVTARKEVEIQSAAEEQDELTERLKSEFTAAQFKFILELQDATNYRNAVEKQYMYLEGLKDGMKLLKHFNDFLVE